MMKKTWMLGAAIALGLSLTSCSQDPLNENPTQKQEGRLLLTLKTDANFGQKANVAQSRAVNEEDYKVIDNYTVEVTVGNEIVYKSKVSDLPTTHPYITMPIGAFKAKVYYGEEHAYSRDQFYVVGENEGYIATDNTQEIKITCTPTCGRIAVNFGQDAQTGKGMDEFYSDYYVTFAGTEAMGENTISWLKDDTEPWYVKLNEHEETINYTITAFTKDTYMNGEKSNKTTAEGSFTLARNKAHKLNINPVYTPSTEGKFEITIEIDDTTVEKNDTTDVPVDLV